MHGLFGLIRSLWLLAFVSVLLLFPIMALAQDAAAEGGSSMFTTILGVALPLLAVVGGSSVVSAFVRSKGGPVRTGIMKIVDALAFNWLRARNDPHVNS